MFIPVHSLTCTLFQRLDKNLEFFFFFFMVLLSPALLSGDSKRQFELAASKASSRCPGLALLTPSGGLDSLQWWCCGRGESMTRPQLELSRKDIKRVDCQ